VPALRLMAPRPTTRPRDEARRDGGPSNDWMELSPASPARLPGTPGRPVKDWALRALGLDPSNARSLSGCTTRNDNVTGRIPEPWSRTRVRLAVLATPAG